MGYSGARGTLIYEKKTWRRKSRVRLPLRSLSVLARYLQNGQIVDVEEHGGLLDATRPMDFLPGFSLEGIK